MGQTPRERAIRDPIGRKRGRREGGRGKEQEEEGSCLSLWSGYVTSTWALFLGGDCGAARGVILDPFTNYMCMFCIYH